MKLEQIAIYDSIKRYMDKIPVVRVKKGGYIVRHDLDNGINKYYIVQGSIKVYNSIGSRKFQVDATGADWFTGNLSKVYKQYLNCDVIAAEETILLEFAEEIFEELLKDAEFAKIFYYKSSQRVFQMYKRLLVNDMYSQREVLSYYILENEKDGRCVCPAMSSLCEILGFSRRSFYNALNSLIDEGLVEKRRNCIFICDKDTLMAESRFAMKDAV